MSPAASVGLLAAGASKPTGSPWGFHAHPAAWAVVVLVAGLYVWVLAHPLSGSERSEKASRKQWACFVGGLLSLGLAITWPIADLAAHWSLTALLGQRLLLTLAAAPLLLLALPSPTLARITRPAPVDAALQFFTNPVVAVVTFTVIAIGTLTAPAVAAQSSSPWARAGIDALLLVGGFVLWAPVLRHIPGAYRLTPLGSAVYLFVQSIVPTFPAVIYVFARRPLYPTFAAAHGALGISPAGDQHLAGVVAKVATLPVMWTVAWICLARAQAAEQTERDAYPLTWAEVERQLQRAERAEHHRTRRRPRVRAIPRPMAGGWTTGAIQMTEQSGELDLPGDYDRPGDDGRLGDDGRPGDTGPPR
jgi:cytochrome c oxidase assembly factor CtaG